MCQFYRGTQRLITPLLMSLLISLLAVLYLVMIVLFYSLPSKKSHLPPPGEIHLIHIDGHHFVSIFPVFVFAFTCAQNMLPVHNEMRASTATHFGFTRQAVVTSISLAGAVYLVSDFLDLFRLSHRFPNLCHLHCQLVGVLGYLSFGSNVGDNIITMYPSTSLFVCFGRVSIVVLTLCSYPMQVRALTWVTFESDLKAYICLSFQVHPCRAALDKVFSWNQEYAPVVLGEEEGTLGSRAFNGDAADREAEEDDFSVDSSNGRDALLGSRAQAGSAPVRPSEMSLRKLCILTCAILTSTFIIALLVDDLGLILGFVGSVGSTSISFIVRCFCRYVCIWAHSFSVRKTPISSQPSSIS